MRSSEDSDLGSVHDFMRFTVTELLSVLHKEQLTVTDSVNVDEVKSALPSLITSEVGFGLSRNSWQDIPTYLQPSLLSWCHGEHRRKRITAPTMCFCG